MTVYCPWCHTELDASDFAELEYQAPCPECSCPVRLQWDDAIETDEGYRPMLTGAEKVYGD